MSTRPYVNLLRSLVTEEVRFAIAGVSVPVVGRVLLRRMKLASGRAQDIVDAELLKQGDE